MHKALRIILSACSLLFLGIGTYLACVTYTQSDQALLFLASEPMLAWSSVIVCYTLVALCTATALSYRKPLHELSHDALMADMGDLLKIALGAVFKGYFDAVPVHRRCDEIATYLKSQVRGLDLRIAVLVGKLGDALLSTTEGMGEAELLKIQQKLTMMHEMEAQASVELASVEAIVQEMEEKLARFEVLGESNDTLYSELNVAISDIHRRMENLAPQNSGKITPFPPPAS